MEFEARRYNYQLPGCAGSFFFDTLQNQEYRVLLVMKVLGAVWRRPQNQKGFFG